IMKKSIITVALTLLMLLSLSALMGQALKPVAIELYDFGGSYPDNIIYPQEGTIEYTVYVTARPDDIQYGPHPLCTAAMDQGKFILSINMGNFDLPWDNMNGGETMRIEVVQTTTGRIVNAEFPLEAGNNPQARFDENAIVLVDPPTAIFDSNDGDIINQEGLTMAAGYPMDNVYRANGWAAGDDWNIQLSTVGFENVTITSKLRRQYWVDEEVTFEEYYGPRVFRTYYSTDGETWVQHPVANHLMPNDETWYTVAFDIPEPLWGLANLYIKWELFSAAGMSNDGWGEIKDVAVYGDATFVPPVYYNITGTFTSETVETTGVTVEATNNDDVNIVVDGSTYTVTVPEDWSGIITPSKEGFVFTPATREYANVNADIDAQDYVIGEGYDIPGDTVTPIDETTDVEITGAGFEGADIVTEGFTAPPNPNFVPTSRGIISLVGTGEVTIQFIFDPALVAGEWFAWKIGGTWFAVKGPLASHDVTVDLGAKDGDLEWARGGGGNPTLPVELSIFNAVLTAQNFVKLTWVSESETGMLGYNVYRNETETQEGALKINPLRIEATNTSTTQTYFIEDNEVVIGTTYYYWLEAVDMTHSTFFGPQYVEVTGTEIPELPTQNVMRSAYPNPLNKGDYFNLYIDVKAGVQANVVMINSQFELLEDKHYFLCEGSHLITVPTEDLDYGLYRVYIDFGGIQYAYGDVLIVE
ncbi:MAG: hypothetical protein WCS19_07980, partial [Candidatus Cloacimonadaceae bacterium]